MRASGTIRGSLVNTPGTSELISQAASSAAASATAVASVPPRPSVVTSFVAADTPWKPATSTILPASSAATTRCGLMRSIFAFVCEASVSMPAWEPVRDTAS